MIRKAKKSGRPWQPRLEAEPVFNPFASLVVRLDEREPPVLEEELAGEFEAAREKQLAYKAPQAEQLLS
ncbi:MAG: hypothetical protein WCD08_14235 [Steroidobacteraceae bacterium]